MLSVRLNTFRRTKIKEHMYPLIYKLKQIQEKSTLESPQMSFSVILSEHYFPQIEISSSV